MQTDNSRLILFKNILKSQCFIKIENLILGIICLLVVCMDVKELIGFQKAILEHPVTNMILKKLEML